MKRLTIGLMATLLLTAPTMAAGYIPIGPKIYTPNPPIVIHNPDIVTPQAPTITPQDPTITETEVVVRAATHGSTSGPGLYVDTNKAGHWNERCQTFAYVNADCTVMSLNPGGGGFPAVTRTDVVVTANPDIVTPNPDIVTPQPDTVIPQPDSCKRLGIGGSGLGYYSC